MKKYVKSSFSCIPYAIEIIHELASGTNSGFPIFAYEDRYSIPFVFFIWMVTGIVNKYLVISLDQSLCEMLGKLLEPSICVWNTPRANNANFHFCFPVCRKRNFRTVISRAATCERFVKVSDKPIGYFFHATFKTFFLSPLWTIGMLGNNLFLKKIKKITTQLIHSNIRIITLNRLR